MADPSGNQPVVPYLTVSDGAEALAFYEEAFGAVVTMKVFMGPAGSSLGHAQFRIGSDIFYLSDEFPEMGVLAPTTLDGASVALYLSVADADAAHAHAVAAGATELMAPSDQPHGARASTILDPFGHRWMLAQQKETVPDEDYVAAMAEQGATVEVTPDPGAPTKATSDGIWAALNMVDAHAGIRFAVDVLGFTEQIVVPGEVEGEVVHSQLQWPEGGIVQIGTANREGNVFSQQPTGSGNLYVVTANPRVVYDRCVAAGVRVVEEPEEADYDPGGMVFTVADAEGNLWSFGTYAGEG